LGFSNKSDNEESVTSQVLGCAENGLDEFLGLKLGVAAWVWRNKWVL
jgi:hypothetical protein